MSSDNAAEENLITTIFHSTKTTIKEGIELMCLIAILSTYLFVMLKPKGIQNNKALGGQ
ncbi:hypothetical protein [Shewanella algidipiscicola]|uniref:Uncharacterized protein n=1 Tax=Shewanella algidipiscicola TaxID=614070 RepID=A0ABQ4NSL3_9GAMM|nr:hypothetical protein [Shewanella algidipiscicola]GIU02159.1 hypothetical protein TUM4630_32890 [Shewanella algidipiscicola]